MAYCHNRDMGAGMGNNKGRVMTHLDFDGEGSTNIDPQHRDPVPKKKKLFSSLSSLRPKEKWLVRRPKKMVDFGCL